MKLIEETEVKSKKTFKPFDITLRIESPEDVAWLLGVSNTKYQDAVYTLSSTSVGSGDTFDLEGMLKSQMQLFDLAEQLYKNMKAGVYHE